MLFLFVVLPIIRLESKASSNDVGIDGWILVGSLDLLSQESVLSVTSISTIPASEWDFESTWKDEEGSLPFRLGGFIVGVRWIEELFQKEGIDFGFEGRIRAWMVQIGTRCCDNYSSTYELAHKSANDIPVTSMMWETIQ